MFARSIGIGLVTAFLASTAAAQGAGEGSRLAGVYDYVTVEKSADGRPACVERWSLGASGEFRLESGQEILGGRWRKVSENGDGVRLEMSGLTSNGLPDCKGARATGPVSDFQVEVSHPDSAGVQVLGAWEHLGPGKPWIRRPVATLTPVLGPDAPVRP